MCAGEHISPNPHDIALQQWICRQNIELLSRQLQDLVDEDQRAVLSALLAEQREKLAGLGAAGRKA